MTRQRRGAPVESPYVLEVREELSGEQLAALRQSAAEEAVAQDQLKHVVDLDQLEDAPDQEFQPGGVSWLQAQRVPPVLHTNHERKQT